MNARLFRELMSNPADEIADGYERGVSITDLCEVFDETPEGIQACIEAMQCPDLTFAEAGIVIRIAQKKGKYAAIRQTGYSPKQAIRVIQLRSRELYARLMDDWKMPAEPFQKPTYSPTQ